ncbi:VWA domain-containing protein [Faecalibacter sp. LW9]|uniref:vWA domain-containing protein n=1 Tax=Faecalibacter sp. LW9 TaxID=3103144 RepID=UPI002AFE437E|nr:VWA domain-containing protein [Faecalibacter sp. LW9]
MFNFEFQNPWYLALLLILPFFIYREIRRSKVKAPALKISTLKPFGATKSNLSRYKPLLFAMRIIAMALCIVAFARPRIVDVTTQIKADEGVDILVTVDTSLSMLTQDLKPDRLSALKEVAKEFSMQRPTDRIGLVEYSGEALTRVPLTTDREMLVAEIDRLQSGNLEDGTAIGVGLATAINHLKDSKAVSKVVILITDGVESINPSAELMYFSPRQAAEIAASKGIKVYTIGIGTNGQAPSPTSYDLYGNFIFEMRPVEIDEVLLQDIADKTGGLYFRATNNENLKNIYKEIDRLEKSEINEIKYYNYTELFARFLLPALIILLAEIVLRRTIFKELI